MTFLALRFLLVTGCFALWVWLAGARLPTPRQAADAALVGLLLHVGYLGGVFQAIAWGTEAGLSALIVGLQPVATTLIAARALGERLVPAQWLGMALGIAGVALVVLRKLEAGVGDWRGVGLCVAALLAISAGSVLQKRRGGETPVLSGTAVQFAAAAGATSVLALLLETREIAWTAEFAVALGWLVLVLSLGAVSLLLLLIRRGAASNVASLFFLVPPATALIAWALFGERMGPPELLGMALTAAGVLIVNRPGVVSRARRPGGRA
jgi:drug/metabolite transporter (DMT)-like permease